MIGDLERELANPERTYTALAVALGWAVLQTPCDVTALSRQIYARDLELDTPPLVDLLVVLVGLLATKLEQSPRAIWEQLWQDAPTDAWWKAHTRPPEGGS